MIFKSKEFQDLKNEWYRKLKDTGFNDLDQDENSLKTWDSSRLTRKIQGQYYVNNKVYNEAREEYYRQAGWFLNDYRWGNYLRNPKKFFYKEIWTLHSEGISIRNIVKILKLKGIKISQDPVNRIILNFSKKMFKKYGVTNE